MAMKSPLAEYGLDNLDCPICHNTGQIPYMKDGFQYSRDCSCMPKRKALRNIERSGLGKLLKEYTLEKYKPDTPETAELLQTAKEFISQQTGWLYLCGRPGSGKTHLCTGICSKLIHAGVAVLYMIWRDECVRLKYAVSDKTDDYYQRRMKELKEIPVLYIDDFLKGSITPADVQLAFELISSRYNDSSLRTIISSEISMERLLKIDEALGRRIYQRSGRFCLESPPINRSLQQPKKQ